MSTLLHLVSEQTMQNLLPILALRPKHVIQVRSRADKFHRAANNLKNAVAALRETLLYRDLNPEFVEVVIDEESPSVDSSRAKVAELLHRWPETIVNLTGGTKQMSIGAYLAAENAPRLYCDTAIRQFIAVGPQPLPVLPPFEQIAASLTVEAVMAAHGVPPDNWKFDRATNELRAVGRAGYAAWQADPQSFRAFGEAVRRHFRNDNGRIPQAVPKLRELIAKPIPATSPSLHPFLEAVAAAGLLERSGADAFVPAVAFNRPDVERLANLLDGSWLELYVVDMLTQHTDRWSDPHWSVEPRRPAEAVFGETDVVCVNIAACALQIISCKTTLRQPLETLEALTQRRRDMGGIFGKATLAVLQVAANERPKLTNWARMLNVELLIGDDITRAFTP
jgi:hypothetical protein